MVLFVERTCARMIVEHLPESQTTVGVEVNVRHLAPTPLDGEVHIEAEITAVEGDLVTFQARLWDEIEEVGQAHHRRMIIDRERFLRRVKSKAASAS
jgi:predicted thioesterase